MILPEYFGATSKNSFHVLTGSVTNLFRFVIPVVPQSLGSWYSLFGSHQRPLNCLSMYFWLGIFDQSIFWIRPSSSMPGVYSAVGAPKSYWPVPPAWSFASISSLLANVA